jgi:Leucine-rich repeat (LRR) protein
LSSSIQKLNQLTELDLYGNALSGTIEGWIGELSNLQALLLYSNRFSGNIPNELNRLGNVLYLELYDNILTGSIPMGLTNLSNVKLLYLDSNLLSGTIPIGIGNMTKLVQLNLNDNALVGSIPESITELKHLQVLYLYDNYLSGVIPNDIGTMISLKQLLLSNNSLAGTIPESIVKLKNLQRLHLFSNQLSGPIPIDIGNMTSLTQLYLDQNDLEDTIPNSLSMLEHLQALSLGSNKLIGTIPNGIGNMTSLTFLELIDNQLTGTIPSSIVNLTNLQFLYLYSNILTGTIPTSIDNMALLIECELYDNYLTGNIPANIGNLKNIQRLYLDSNKLSGMIPTSIGAMKSLTELYLYSNDLTGTIPDSLVTLESLQHLIIYSCRLSGTIPNDIGQLTTLMELDFSNNYLTGVIPDSIADLENLRQLFLDYNKLSGTIPTDIDKLSLLVTLSLSNNNLTGIIPNSICKIRNLLWLIVSYNRFSGSIPNDISNLTSLTELELAYNYLTGTISNSIMQLKSLRWLLLDSNKLNGTIPNEISNLRVLIQFSLDYNELTGTIPNSIVNLIHLQSFTLVSNQLVGTIPNDIGNMTSLVFLELTDNQLTGTIPNNITKLTNLQFFYSSSTQLHGTIPMDIGNMISLTELYLDGNDLTGSIPDSIIKLKMLQRLYLFSNQLSGCIPKDIGNMTSLSKLYLYDNYITNTIPDSIGNIKVLQTIALYNNIISGTIPQVMGQLNSLAEILLDSNVLRQSCECIFSTLQQLEIFTLSHNLFTGILPNINSSAINIFDINNNLFTGTLSDNAFLSLTYYDVSYNLLSKSISSIYFPNIKYYYLNDNYLSGTLPDWIKNMNNLTYLFLANNQFEGNISDYFNSISTASSPLQQLDLSSNYFTGSLPDVFFTSTSSLEVFVASKNCLSGTISDSICQANTLVTLVLDGLSTANRCKKMIWSSISSAYLLPDNAVHGSIPSCLFNMSKLQTLHLSGNSLKGRLQISPNNIHYDSDSDNDRSLLESLEYKKHSYLSPSRSYINRNDEMEISIEGDNGSNEETLGKNLSEISLSHNQLTGSIPTILQQGGNRWKNLDLSFNKLRGRLSQSTAKYNNSKVSVSFDINRLSGDIPSVYNDIEDINILKGNIFSCKKNVDGSKNLPLHDSYESEYVCGSDTLNTSLIVWIVLFTLFILIVIIAWVMKGKGSTSMDNIDNKVNNRRKDDVEDLIVWLIQFIQTFYRPALFPFGKNVKERYNDKNENNQENDDNVQSTKENNIEIIGNDICLISFHLLHHIIITFSFRMVVFIVVFAIPIYSALSYYYGTYEDQYAWSSTIAYLSGESAALILWTFFVALVIVVFILTRNVMKDLMKEISLYNDSMMKINTMNNINCKGHDDKYIVYLLETFAKSLSLVFPSPYLSNENNKNRKVLVNDKANQDVYHGLCWKRKCCSNNNNDYYVLKVISMSLANVIIVVTVNGLFVYASLQAGNEVTLILALLLSLFKLGWNRILLYAIYKYFHYDEIYSYNDQQINKNHHGHFRGISRFYSRLMMFNTILAPCLGSLIANADCFYYAFVSADSISTTYAYSTLQCQNSNLIDGHMFFCSLTKTEKSLSYDPPFIYSYQCSSAILNDYAYVFVYKYIFLGIVYPMIIWIVLLSSTSSPYKGQSADDNSNNRSDDCSDTTSIYNQQCLLLRNKAFPLIWKSREVIWNRLIRQYNQQYNSDKNQHINNNVGNNNKKDNRRLPTTYYEQSDNVYKGKFDVFIDHAVDTAEQIHSYHSGRNVQIVKSFFSHEEYIVRMTMMLVTLLTFGVAIPYLSILILFSIFTNTLLMQAAMRRLFVDMNNEVNKMIMKETKEVKADNDHEEEQTERQKERNIINNTNNNCNKNSNTNSSISISISDNLSDRNDKSYVSKVWPCFLSDLRSECLMVWPSFHRALQPLPLVMICFYALLLVDIEGDEKGWFAGIIIGLALIGWHVACWMVYYLINRYYHRSDENIGSINSGVVVEDCSTNKLEDKDHEEVIKNVLHVPTNSSVADSSSDGLVDSNSIIIKEKYKEDGDGIYTNTSRTSDWRLTSLSLFSYSGDRRSYYQDKDRDTASESEERDIELSIVDREEEV